MVCKASGKYYRKGMPLIEIMNMFPDDENAKKWVKDNGWAKRILSKLWFGNLQDTIKQMANIIHEELIGSAANS